MRANLIVLAVCLLGSWWTRLASADLGYIQPPELLEPGSGCELVLRIYHNNSGSEQELYVVTDTHDPVPTRRYRNGVCIKRVGETIRLPENFLIWSNDVFKHQHRLRAEGSVCAPNTAERRTSVDNWGTCTWSGVYRNKYPFTFELEANEALQSLVSAVRIYRNGAIAYAWSSAPELYPVRMITVAGSRLKRRRTPHAADFDLRIFPVDDHVVTPEIVEQAIKTRKDWTEDFINSIAVEEKNNLAQRDVSPDVSPADAGERTSSIGATQEKKSLSHAPPGVEKRSGNEGEDFCRESELSASVAQAQRLIEAVLPAKDNVPELRTAGSCCPRADTTASDARPNAWAPVFEPRVRNRLRDALRALTGKSLGTCTKLEDELREAIGALARADARASSTNETAITDNAASREHGATTAQALSSPACTKAAAKDAQLALTALVGPIEALCRGLHEDSSAREQSLTLALALAHDVESRGSATEALVPNPQVLPGERSLDMTYGDTFQWYGLGGWTAAPLKITGDVSLELRPTVVLPIVDVAGARWMWGPSRLSEFRLASGVAVLQESIQRRGREKDRLCASWHFNVSVGTFRVGLASVIRDGRREFTDSLRLLIGVDLVKLITGDNFEAF
jgi:hypothetical protein